MPVANKIKNNSSKTTDLRKPWTNHPNPKEEAQLQKVNEEKITNNVDFKEDELLPVKK